MFATIAICSLVYAGYRVASSIWKQRKDPESDWCKFWKLYSSVEDQERQWFKDELVIKSYSLYKTIKVVILTRYEEQRNKIFKSILKETYIDDNKLILPVFIEDEIYYICLDKVSNVREYDIIDINFISTKMDIKHTLNKMINHSSSPYRVSSLTPTSLKQQNLNVTYIKDGEIKMKYFKNNEEMHID